MPTWDKVFRAAVESRASDIHIAPNEPLMLRQHGQLIKLKSTVLTADQNRQIIMELLDQEQKQALTRDMQLDFVYEIEELGRFRGSAMEHNSGLSASFRVIPPGIPGLRELGMPQAVIKSLDNHQGMVLVTGPAGQGKSTTLSAMVDHINTHRAHHVLTVEDPIEFVHPLKKGVVNQRQLGRDTASYANALRAALREDPDVIMIGEMRDLETMALAVSAAETGHLVLGTMSSTSAPKTVDRIVDSFPPGEQSQIRAMLSEALKAVITQRLLPSKMGQSLEMALEVLIVTLPIANLIRDGKVFQIPSMMQTGKRAGMQIMDESLLELVREGRVLASEAVLYANKTSLFRQYVAKEKR